MIFEIEERLHGEMKALLEGVDDPYYKSRVDDAPRLFNDVERVIARWCVACLPPSARICEPGAGFGQMSLLLASLGFSVTGIDSDEKRRRTATELAKRLGLAAVFISGEYPSVAPDCDLLVVTNMIGGWWDKQPGSETEKLLRFFKRPALICPTTWYKPCKTEEQMKKLRYSFLEAGFLVNSQSDLCWHVVPV